VPQVVTLNEVPQPASIQDSPEGYAKSEQKFLLKEEPAWCWAAERRPRTTALQQSGSLEGARLSEA